MSCSFTSVNNFLVLEIDCQENNISLASRQPENVPSVKNEKKRIHYGFWMLSCFRLNTLLELYLKMPW